MNNSQIGVKSLYNLALKIEQAEMELSRLKQAFRTEELEVHDSMIAEGVDSIEYNGIKFSPDTNHEFALADGKGSWDEDPRWFSWLREIGEDGIIKTKESVHAATRKKFLRDWAQEHGKLPEFIRESFHPQVKFNKAEIERRAKVDSHVS